MEPRLSAASRLNIGEQRAAMDQDEPRGRRGAFLPAPLPAPLSHVAITARHVSSASSANFTSPPQPPANKPQPGRAPVIHDRIPTVTKPKQRVFAA